MFGLYIRMPDYSWVLIERGTKEYLEKLLNIMEDNGEDTDGLMIKLLYF